MASQDNWRWCHKCAGLWYNGHSTKGSCPAGATHDFTGSGNYTLQYSPASGQDNWRWCHKCEGLHFAGDNQFAACPGGGVHSLNGSGDYVLTGAPAQGQDNWRWCQKLRVCGTMGCLRREAVQPGLRHRVRHTI
jgi:hypothetical protein